MEKKRRSQFGELWHNPDFLKLWLGETVSLFGSQITLLAFPLTAVLTLHATAVQVGFLGALQFAPFLFVTLFAGVWVDRHRRRFIMLTVNMGRAVLLASIPLCAFLGLLRIEYLYVIAFLVGVLTVFFQLSYQSFLPVLVQPSQLVEGNSKLNVGESVAQIGGPGVAGVLVQLITAPMAILLDAFSFLISSFTLLLIRKREPAPIQTEDRRNLWQEISEGLHVTFDNRYLRAIAGEAATYNLFWRVIETVYVLFAVRELHISPAIIGLIFAIGSIGSLLGALLADRTARLFGMGPTILGAMVLSCLVTLLLPLASGPTFGALLLAFVAFVGEVGVTVSNIHVTSLRQTVTPGRLLGRMNASYRFFTWGVIPLGALLSGFLGEKLGLRPTLFIGALGLMIAWLWVLFSPVRKLRQLPTPEITPSPPATESVNA